MTDDEWQERINAMHEQTEKLMQVIGDLERELRGKRLTIRWWERRWEEAQDKHNHAREAKECYEFWKAELRPKAREFSGSRRDAVLARLKAGYTVEDIKQGILGAKVDAFVGPNGVRHDDLELICRSAQKLDAFIERYKAHEQKHNPRLSMRQAFSEFMRAGLHPRKLAYAEVPSFETFCPVCSSDVIVSDTSERVEIVCNGGCTRSQIADGLYSRTARGAA